MDYEPGEDDKSTTDIIKVSLQIYGSLFLVAFTIYVAVRPKFPSVYNFCNSVREYNTALSAKNHFGHIKWIWKNFQHSDDEIYENCGLTALVMLRFLRIGVKVSLVGVFNSIYLIPVNLYGCDDQDVVCNQVVDSIDRIGMGHVSQGSLKLLATTVAAYLLFGSALYLIYNEFTWFTSTRHKFLAVPRPDNFSVYVAHIPQEYRGDVALAQYFRSIFDPDDVLEANVALDLFGLESKIAQRDTLLKNLEHAVNLRDVKGYEPFHLTKLGEKKESIPFYQAELQIVNEQISLVIEQIETAKEEEARRLITLVDKSSTDEDREISRPLLPSESQSVLVKTNNSSNHFDMVDTNATSIVIDKCDDLERKSSLYAQKDNDIENATNGAIVTNKSMKSASGVEKSINFLQHGLKKSANVIKQTGHGLQKLGGISLDIATNLISGSDDGRVRDGGFVTFSTLLAKNQCVQMIHHGTPFTFQVSDAPLPKHIFWSNVGLPHRSQQIGYLIAQLLTTGLCLFWTIPVTFVSSFSQIDSLKQVIPNLDSAIQKHPWIEQLLAQLNPVLMVVLKMMLPAILSKFCEREGHISQTQLSASLFTKLSLFLIIQIFFVPALAGVAFSSLSLLAEQPTQIIGMVAKNVPSQAKSFIQYILVSVLLGCGLEVLRLAKVIKAFIRRYIGPNLTDEERKTTYMGFSPLTEPDEMDFPISMAEIILYIMILLVYGCIAPIMSYVMLMAFGLMLITFTNQFIFIYTAASDEGGSLWPKMVKVTLICVVIAELILIGLMSLNQSVLSSILLIPLLCCSILFIVYLEQQHYRVINVVPSTMCKLEDRENEEKLDKSFLKGQYTQPALKAKMTLPSTGPLEENYSECPSMEDNVYMTPEGSLHDSIDVEKV